MTLQQASLLRTLLKIGGTVLVQNGYTNDAGLEVIVGVAIGLIGAAWSYLHHAKPVSNPVVSPVSTNL